MKIHRKGKYVIDRTCVIITSSSENQKKVINKLISLGGCNSNNEFDKNNSFENGHIIIYIYGYTGIKGEKEKFMFCTTKSVARNEYPIGELAQKNIERYFLKVRTNAGKEKLLSRKNVNIYAPYPQKYYQG